jgi:FKBP-type peptidyl-prolyl cis-trans isomerase FklB
MKGSAAFGFMLGLGLALTIGTNAQEGAEPPTLETDSQRWSYAIGLNVGNNLKQGNVEVDPQLIAQGIADALAGETHMDDAQVRQALQVLQTAMQEGQRRAMEESSQRNLEEGQAFLTENGQREGVTTTASGLQYEVMTPGTGARPTARDRVRVHYHGTLIDGTVFDSSVQRNDPAEFPVTGVIRGWVEALQLMPVGSKWKLFIPADLAYGANPRPGGPIGPNAVLVFEVELLAIVQ